MSVKLRSKKLSNGSESFYLDIYLKGSRQYEFLDIKIKKNDPQRKQKKEIAEAKRSKRELELLANYHDVPKNFNGDDDFLEYFKNSIKDSTYQGVYNRFEEFIESKTINGKFTFKLLSEKLIEDFRISLNKDLANSTTWVYMLKLKAVLNKAVKEQLLGRSPARYVKQKLDDIERVFLTEDELKAMAEAESKDVEVKRAYMFACFTGLRISDIMNLTWSQIKEDKLYFRQKKTKGIEYLPLAKSALKYLYMEVNKQKIVVDQKVFKLGKTETVNNRLREWAKEAKIKKYLTFHSARHTFATLSLSSGIDLYTVSKMMGHKSIKMTEIYAKIINKTVEEAITRLPNI